MKSETKLTSAKLISSSLLAEAIRSGESDHLQAEKLLNSNNVAEIRLQGEPYQRVVDGEKIDATEVLERLAVNEDYDEKLLAAIERNAENLLPLIDGGFYGVDRKIKKGESLTYEEAFSLMTFVTMASNKRIREILSPLVKIGDLSRDTVLLQGVSLLSAMSTKEAFVGLSPEEIAGLTASAIELDTVIRVSAGDTAFGIGGMGGDRGYPKNGDNSKLFSLSTMGAAVLSCFDRVHKHHSYPNTSKVAGQTAIEAIGGRSDQDSRSQFDALQETNLLMTSCHTTRTLHTISHRLKGETINHVVGPLAIPVAKETELTAMIGVNDNVHPETIIASLQILDEKGVQSYGNSVAFCGLKTSDARAEEYSVETYYQNPEKKKMVVLDEVAPPPYDTLAAFLVGGQNMGSFVIKPSDFLDGSHLAQIDFKGLMLPNEAQSILKANRDAISGQDTAKSIYLAMTAALGLFTKYCAGLEGALDQKSRRVNPKMLHQCFLAAYEAITDGTAVAKIDEYVLASQAVLSI